VEAGRHDLALSALGSTVWAACGYGIGMAVTGIAPQWYQATGFVLVALFYALWRRARNELAWLRCQETGMVERAKYQGRLSALPTRQQSDAMRAMVMDPEIDETMRAALQPLADYLEHMERVRAGAEED
jgi:hypothetical protein